MWSTHVVRAGADPSVRNSSVCRSTGGLTRCSLCASSLWEKPLGFPMPDGRSFLLLTLELLRAAAAVRQTRRLVTIDFRISLTLATAPVHKAAAFEAVHTTRSGQSIPSELSLYESKLIIIWAVGTRPSASLFGSILVLSRCVRRGDHPSDRAPILHPPPTWRAVGFRCSERAPESNSVRSGARLLKFGLSNPLHWPPLHEGPGSPDLT